MKKKVGLNLDMNKCFKTRNNDQWATPTNIYNLIVHEYGYVDFNPLCENYDDSLKKEFDCDLYCNPPFSNIEPFVDYMIEHNKKGYRVLMLLPVRSGTKWFRKIMFNNHCFIGFFTQRLHFNDLKSAPFDCMLVFFTKSKIMCPKVCFIDRNLHIKGIE